MKPLKTLSTLYRPTLNPALNVQHARYASSSSSPGSGALKPITLTHLDQHGRASMVDVGDKAPSSRSATATGRIIIPFSAYELVAGDYPSGPALSDDVVASQAKARRKGDALTVAQLAAIMASKKTSDLIPLCHPLPLTKVDVRLTPEERTASATVGSQYSIFCEATVKCEGKTGVEMEALTAVSVGLLTVWDMLKAVAGKEMEITDIKVTKKSGGRSGDFARGA